MEIFAIRAPSVLRPLFCLLSNLVPMFDLLFRLSFGLFFDLLSYFIPCSVVSLLSHPLRSRLLVSALCRPYFALGALAHIYKYISAQRLLLSSLSPSIHPSLPYYVLSIVDPYIFLSTSTNQPTDSVETWCGHHYKK